MSHARAWRIATTAIVAQIASTICTLMVYSYAVSQHVMWDLVAAIFAVQCTSTLLVAFIFWFRDSVGRS